ncbi:MAG: acyl-CoA dehydrogenase family protein, partial [Acidimicrobiia bacterium]
VAVPEVAKWVTDRAIQAFGAAGFTADFPLASFYAVSRWLQIADGPDEVHKRSLAHRELARYQPGQVPEPYRF